MTYTPPSQITVRAQPHLNLRREPLIRPDNVIAQLPDGSTWPVAGVARDNFNAASDVLWLQIIFTNAATGRRENGFCRSDFVSPRPDPLPATQQVQPAGGLNLRRTPVFDTTNQKKIVTMRGGSTLRVVGGAWENFDPASGKWWYLVEYEGQRGYAYSRFLVPAGGAPPVGPPAPAWRFGACLAGVGSADPNTWHEPTFQDAIQVARLEAIKLVQLGDNDKMNRVYAWLRSQGIPFVMVRLNWKPDPAWVGLPAAERMNTAVRSFINTVRPQLEFAYANGVRYFEVHNEPNITRNPTDEVGDGLGTAWMNAAEFAVWFSRVVDELRAIRGDVRLGFPGLAPRDSEFADFGQGPILANGQTLRWNIDEWLAVCKPVIDAKADWLGIHCYWQFDGGGMFGLENVQSGGMYWKRHAPKFPSKLVFITELSNNGAGIDLAEKGRQYAKYVALLRREPAIGAVFGFALFWASDPNNEGWVRLDNQNRFFVSALPGAMGAALAANPATATRILAASPGVWV